MPTIKTVSVEYGRKVNLGDYNSATVGCTLWADIEEGEDLHQVMSSLWATVKNNVHAQVIRILKDPRNLEPGDSTQENFLGLPIGTDSGVGATALIPEAVEGESTSEEVNGPDTPPSAQPSEKSQGKPASRLLDVEEAKRVRTPKGTPFVDLEPEQLGQIVDILEGKEASALTEHELQMLAAARTLLYEATLPF